MLKKNFWIKIILLFTGGLLVLASDVYAGKRSPQFKILTRHADKCLDLKKKKISNRTTIHQWGCKRDIKVSDNKLWVLEDAGGGYVAILNQKSIRKGTPSLIDMPYNKQGGRVHLYRSYLLANQLWKLESRGSSGGRKYYAIRSKKNNNLCLDIHGASKSDGARLIVWACKRSSNQEFAFYIPRSHKMTRFIQDVARKTAGAANNLKNRTVKLSKDLKKEAIKASRSVKKVAKYSFESTKKFGKRALKKSLRGMKTALKKLKEITEKIGKALFKKIAEPIKNKFLDTGKGIGKVYKTLFTGNKQGGKLLIEGIRTGNASKIVDGIKKIGASPFKAFVDDIKKSGGGSLMIQVEGSAGGVVAGVSGAVGIAIGLGNMVRFIKAMREKRPFTGPLGSLYISGGVGVGATSGSAAGITIGWHVANPSGVGGPSGDVTFSGTFKGGGSIAIGLDLSVAPPKFANFMIGFQEGAYSEATIGLSFGQVVGKVCGNGTLKKFDEACPTASSNVRCKYKDRSGKSYQVHFTTCVNKKCKPHKVNDPGACAALCRRTGGCRHFFYAKFKNRGKICYLLTKAKSYSHRAEKDRSERCSGNR